MCVQIAQTKSIAEATKQEADRIRKSIGKFDIAQESTRATTAISNARKSFSNADWPECVEQCEIVIGSISIMKQHAKDGDIEIDQKILKAESYLKRLCERIDRNSIDETDNDDFAKSKSSLRQHEISLVELSRSIRKETIIV